MLSKDFEIFISKQDAEVLAFKDNSKGSKAEKLLGINYKPL